MTDNLDVLSLPELKDLRSRVERAINSYEERKKHEALVELEETARKMGYSLADLTGVHVARKRKAVEPKYANPADPSDTWTGRGRKPRWVVEALESGKTMEDISI
ncbi:H-NS family nucleoid-associated regulatory protein [Albirhodobacter sp. R86504]|jgi:DNA-binding protein H-NS|uniref:H-NS histone family protein n=1 Tax=Albirhodobacter sp. R86504 TaxID=3093848 RepID=UPI00366FF4BE